MRRSAGGALERELIERADFRDAYRVPLRRPDLGVVDIFFGVFAHRPRRAALSGIRSGHAPSRRGMVVLGR